MGAVSRGAIAGKLTFRKRLSGHGNMAPGRLTVLLLWLVATARASERRKNKKKALKAAAGRPPSMTLDARPLKYKDAIPPDGPGLREVAYGSQKLVVENTCFYAGNRARIDDERDIKRGLCKYAGSWREYLEKLGVVGRDTSKHPWGE